ncbi:MAG: hypothetical protein CVV27_04350 [Candidatus Melainabacteria bacterium HGW-Melainabacteria-1]|nr:MAG: hypothetical protein CVV27_04350 [Candidatus Melainabacteria bacterium HGW-Melainabacteria-1]
MTAPTSGRQPGKPSAQPGKPFVPIPPQIAEAEDLASKLQELLSFLKSTEPDSDKTRQTAQMVHKLEAKLKQVHQRVRLHGSPEPDLRGKRPPQPPPADTRRPEDIQVLTAEIAAQGQQLSKGPEVVVLQQILQFCGFAIHHTGLFDGATVTALRAFQTRNKLPVSGRVDDKTRPLLNLKLKMLRAGLLTKATCRQALDQLRAHNELQLTMAVDTKLERLFAQLIRLFLEPAYCEPPEPMPVPAAPSPEQIHALLGTAGAAHITSKGPEVGLLQQVLLAAGQTLNVNDTFDLQTFTALKAFQAAAGLPVSGETDLATREQVNLILARRFAFRNFRHTLAAAANHFAALTDSGLNRAGLDALERLLDLSIYLLEHPQAAEWPGVDPQELLQGEFGPAGQGQRISHGPQVLLLQELLQALGFDLSTNEVYDPATAKAVRTFQGQHKLPLSGLVDARTREALNAELTQIRQGQSKTG